MTGLEETIDIFNGDMVIPAWSTLNSNPFPERTETLPVETWNRLFDEEEAFDFSRIQPRWWPIESADHL